MSKPQEHEIPIHIENKMYKATKTPMTGAELRVLAEPDIGADRDLFLTVPGQGDDVLIADDRPVDLKPGMHGRGLEKGCDFGL